MTKRSEYGCTAPSINRYITNVFSTNPIDTINIFYRLRTFSSSSSQSMSTTLRLPDWHFHASSLLFHIFLSPPSSSSRLQCTHKRGNVTSSSATREKVLQLLLRRFLRDDTMRSTGVWRQLWGWRAIRSVGRRVQLDVSWKGWQVSISRDDDNFRTDDGTVENDLSDPRGNDAMDEWEEEVGVQV